MGSRNPRDAECGDNLLNGDAMKTEAQSNTRDREATTARSRLALFVVAEPVSYTHLTLPTTPYV